MYADHLGIKLDGQPEHVIESWIAKGDDLFINLLFAISRAVGYDFDEVQLRRGAYYPKAHDDADVKWEFAERQLLRVLAGEQPLAMSIKDFPADPGALDLQAKAYKAFVGSVDSDGAIKVKRAGA